MSTPYVTFPGTDWAFTDDVNLLDADTAHLQQSGGKWASSTSHFNATSIDYQATTLTPLFGTYHLEWAATAIAVSSYLRTDESPIADRFAVAPSTEYTFRVDMASNTAARSGLISIVWYNAANAVILGSDSAAVALTTDGTWTTVSVTATSPATATTATIQISLRKTGGGNIAAGDMAYAHRSCLRAGASTGFVPSLRIVGDLDMRASVAADDWTPAAAEILLDHYVAGTGGYRLGIETSGAISLVAHGATGAISESSSLYALTDGEATEIRVTMDASAGDLTWYQDNVEVDDDTYTAQALKPAGLDLYVGALSSDASHFNGVIYWLEVRDGIAGPVVARFDAADIAAVLP